MMTVRGVAGGEAVQLGNSVQVQGGGGLGTMPQRNILLYFKDREGKVTGNQKLKRTCPNERSIRIIRLFPASGNNDSEKNN